MKWVVKIVLIVSCFSFPEENKHPEIVRLHEPSFPGKIDKIIPHAINFSDTIHSDTLYEYILPDGFPVMYARNIPTEVCIDNECRPVNIRLFWNSTGRYLGYKLPEGEFLSKTKHTPFTAEEYDRLHTLLGDPLSPLAHYKITELVNAKDSAKTAVDAVSSATIAAVLDYIVPGAVYTTYTLWHIVYGETKREIELRTSAKLTPAQVIKFLDSEILEDKVWVLNHIPKEMPVTGELLDKLLQLISENDIYLAERALFAIPPERLTSEVQLRLIGSFKTAAMLQKKLIAEKLSQTPELQPQPAELLSGELVNLNGTLIKHILELFETQNIESEQVNNKVALLLNNKNRYIASRAVQFLESREVLDKKTEKKLDKYRKKN
jgi:hypothetical protein